MRRVKLYEAFRSNILSKITAYLKKSGISDREKSNFLNEMNSILGSFKIPIDKIEYDDVEYKSYRDLWKVKAQNNAEKKGINTCNAGIWLIKVINYPLAELLHFPR